jgi:ADP-heptose:LPS heptosyltransferase
VRTERFLILRSRGGLGDVVCMLPALGRFARQQRGATVRLGLPEPYAGLMAHRADGVLTMPLAAGRFHTRWRRRWAALYDRVIDLDGGGDRNRIDYFTERLGLEPEEPTLHFPLTEAEQSAARQWMERQGLAPERPVVCLHLQSARSEKDWPLERARDLAARLQALGYQVLALEAERRLGLPGAAEATGLPLTLAAALIARCDLLIGPDSGPMHLAAFTGTRSVVLFGPTDPEVYCRYYRRTHRWLRAGAVSEIGVEEVLNEVECPDA